MNKLERILMIGTASALLCGVSGCAKNESKTDNNNAKSNVESVVLQNNMAQSSAEKYHLSGLEKLGSNNPLQVRVAISEFEKAIEGYKKEGNIPGLVGSTASLGTAHFMLNEYAPAVSSFEDLLYLNESGGFHMDLKPQMGFHLVRMYLGISYLETRNFEKSFETLYTANLFYPENQDILGWYSKSAKAYIEDLTLRISKAGSQQELENLDYKLGDVYFKAGELTLVQEQAQKILKLNPDSSDAQFLLGEVSFEKKDFAAASKYFERVLRIKKDEQAYHELGACQTNLGNYDDAIITLEKGLGVFPNSARMNFNLGVAYLKVNRTDDALRCLETACANMPERSEYCDALNSVKGVPK